MDRMYNMPYIPGSLVELEGTPAAGELEGTPVLQATETFTTFEPSKDSKPLPSLPPSPAELYFRGRSQRPKSPIAPPVPPKISRKAVGTPPRRSRAFTADSTSAPLSPPGIPPKSERRKMRSLSPSGMGQWRPSMRVSSPRLMAAPIEKQARKAMQLLGEDVDINDATRGRKPGHTRWASDASAISSPAMSSPAWGLFAEPDPLHASLDSMVPPPLDPSRGGQSSRDTSWGSAPSAKTGEDGVSISFEGLLDAIEQEAEAAAGEYHQFTAQLASIDRKSLDDDSLRQFGRANTTTTRRSKPSYRKNLGRPSSASPHRRSKLLYTQPEASAEDVRISTVGSLRPPPNMQSAFDSDSSDEEEEEDSHGIKSIFGRTNSRMEGRSASVMGDRKDLWASARGTVKAFQAFKMEKERVEREQSDFQRAEKRREELRKGIKVMSARPEK